VAAQSRRDDMPCLIERDTPPEPALPRFGSDYSPPWDPLAPKGAGLDAQFNPFINGITGNWSRAHAIRQIWGAVPGGFDPNKRNKTSPS
jgi:hypothetical protein